MIAPTTKAPSRAHLNPEPMFGLRAWWPMSPQQAARMLRALRLVVTEEQWFSTAAPLADDDIIVYANDHEGGW